MLYLLHSIACRTIRVSPFMMTLRHSALPFNHFDIRMKCLSAIHGSFKRAVFFNILFDIFPGITLERAFCYFSSSLVSGFWGVFAPQTPLPRGNRPLEPLHSLNFLFDIFPWNYIRTRILLFFMFTCFRLLGGFVPQTPLPRGNRKKLATPLVSISLLTIVCLIYTCSRFNIKNMCK